VETRANYALIGLFTLTVIAGAFGFVWWFAGSQSAGERASYRVVFSGSVSGLSTGSIVLFNGLRVGEVTDVSLLPEDPRRVVAVVQVAPTTPVRTDTRARLEYQGLTGVASVQLNGGEPGSQPLLGSPGQPPTLFADRSDFQDVLETVQRLGRRVDDVIGRAERLIVDNEGSVGRTFRNVETFTQALSANSEGVGRFLGSVGNAADKIASLSVRLEAFTTDAEAVIRAVDPQRVSRILGNVDSVTETLGANREGIGEAVQNVVALSRRLGETAGKLDAALTGVATLATDASGVAKAVDPAKLGRSLDNLDRFTTALAANDQRLTRIIANVEGITDTVGAGRKQIADTLESVASLSQRLNQAAPRLEASLTSLQTLASDASAVAKAVDPAKLGRSVDNFDRFTTALAANDQRLTRIVTNVEGITDTVSAGRKQIADTLENVASLSVRLNQAAPRVEAAVASLQTFATDASALAKGLDAGKIGRSVDNVERFTTALAASDKGFTRIVSNIESVTDTVAASRQQVTDSLQNVASLTGRLNESAPKLDAALGGVADLTKAIDPARINRSFENVERFTSVLASNDKEINKIFNETAALTTKLNGSAGRLDRVLAGAEGFLGGGAGGIGGEGGRSVIADFGAASRAVQSAASNLDRRITELSAGLNRFTGPGLRELEALTADGRRSLGEVNRLVRSLERNPAQVITGGRPQIPEFQGRR